MKSLVCLLALFYSSSTLALLTVNFYEQGSDVVAEVSGSLNVSGLTPSASGLTSGIGTDSSNSYFYVFGNILPAFQSSYPVTFTSGPTFGPASSVPTSSTGNSVGINGTIPGVADELLLPGGYVSGSFLSSSSTFAGETLASLSLVPGTYTFTYSADSIVFNVLTSPPSPPAATAPVAVPVMPHWLLAIVVAALASFGSVRIARKK